MVHLADPVTERCGIPRSGARDECGVFAVYAPGEDAARFCYLGLYALQHRGQESAGIAVSDGRNILVTKEMGLVNQVFTEARLAGLQGHLGIGHVRYSTTGASTWDNAQPAFKATPGGGLALAHNGNLVNTAELARSASGNQRCASDSELLASLVAGHGQLHAEASTERSQCLTDALAELCDQVRGAFSLVVCDETAVYAARDPRGVRPLVLGGLPGGGYVVASETAALDIVGARYLRDVEPGELVTLGEDGLRSRRFAVPEPAFCVFEYVYLARPDHQTRETSVYAARRRMGAMLAREAPVEADLVIPVPDSGTAAAAGYAQEADLPYAEGLVKNRYVGRTFIQPSDALRQVGIQIKLNPLPDVLKGQRLVVVDDSIVRGNTARKLVAMLRDCGATEVHLRITSPAIKHPCFYGIDMATHGELVASTRSSEEVCVFVGADSLHYLSLDSLVAATQRSASTLCRACFDGQYPIDVGDEHRRAGKEILGVG